MRQEHLATWLARHPTTRVLERPQPERIDYRYSPFKAYWLDDKIPYPVATRDERFHAKELVLGVEVDGRSRAYLGSRLAAAGLQLEDEIAGRKVRIDYEPDEHLGLPRLTPQITRAGARSAEGTQSAQRFGRRVDLFVRHRLFHYDLELRCRPFACQSRRQSPLR